jgi:gamma-glutamyl hercynylcysteine S-oxide synthase
MTRHRRANLRTSHIFKAILGGWDMPGKHNRAVTHTTAHTVTHAIDAPAMRRAGKDLLSLALMDARNHSLHLVGQIERAVPELHFSPAPSAQHSAEVAPPQWWLGHVGWFQEFWIGRNTQRALGAACPSAPTRLASVHPLADRLWSPESAALTERWAQLASDAASAPLPTLKAYLLETLESALELLEKTDDSDAALYFYRLALQQEDQCAERLAVTAQVLDIPLAFESALSTRAREPLLVPATRWQLGTSAGGFCWDNEAPQHEVKVPEFEIDAQAVSWAQYVEFVGDGGYDDRLHWSAAGWDWLQARAPQEGRRGPRFVEQIGVASGAVMQKRFGQVRRAAGADSAMHLSWYEANAYAHWAGRRLPTEVEWELAAHRGAGQGFGWGDVWEWTASTFRPYPGYVPGPWHSYSAGGFERCKVLRGASFATRARMKRPQFRGFAVPENDANFVGFRTCAL